MLEGVRVVLRPIEASDYGKIAEWTNDPEVSRFLDGDYPGDPESCREWHEAILSDRYSKGFIIARKNGDVIGDVELEHIAWRSGDAELRIRIGERSLWDKGYGTEAVLIIMRYAFSQLGLKRIYLRVFASNQRAVRCYQKCGFKPEGMLERRTATGEKRRIMLMRILREEFSARYEGIARTG